jgi:hypothetical protein
MYAILLKITHAKRAILFCSATVLLHLTALNWAGQHLDLPAQSMTMTMPRPMNVLLAQPALSSTRAAPKAAPIALATAAPPARRKKAQAKKSPDSVAPIVAEAINPSLTPSVISDTQINATTEAIAEAVSETQANDPTNNPPPLASEQPNLIENPALPTPPPAADETPPAKSYRVRLPPSVELQYAVRKVDAKTENAATTGRGKIRWINQGEHYKIEGDISILFFTLLNFQSEGEVNTNGIAPLLYTEKRGTRARTNTHFQRDSKMISFSASSRQFPRAEDAQDRASVLWQLAGIGQGDNENINPATTIDIQVASERAAESWRFLITGIESITLSQGELQTWRFTRIPRTGTYERRLDVWLSPTHNWSPVRIRDTEANGTFTEMSMTNFTPL